MSMNAIDLVACIEATLTHHAGVLLVIMKGIGNEEDAGDVAEMSTHLIVVERSSLLGSKTTTSK